MSGKREQTTGFDKYLGELTVGQLRGRFWRAPAFKPRYQQHVIVVIYGHHASLERVAGLAQYLRRFGCVVVPDLPGFGGMDSFYKIDQLPQLENYALYLKRFLEGHLKEGQTFSLLGFSLGFQVVTKFFQLYPDWRPRVRLTLSLAGFLSGRSLQFTARRHRWYLRGITLVKTQFGSWLFRRLILNRWILRSFYGRTFSARKKFIGQPERLRLLKAETRLWQINDVRTWAFTARAMIVGDLSSPPVDLDLYHVAAEGDHFLDNDHNLGRLRLVYNEVKLFHIELTAHAPTVVADVAEVEALMPADLVKVLNKAALMRRG